jgi:SPP1 family predicted phage head-tail adaptor
MTGAAILTDVITLQRVTIERNGLGEGVEAWTTLAQRKANRADVSAGEAFRAQEVGAQLSTRFTIRYSPTLATLNPLDRIVFDGRTYNITGVRQKQRRRWIEIDTVARDDIAAVETT